MAGSSAASFGGFPTGPDADSGGTVTSVSGAAPITSTGGNTPQIGITAATTLAPGSMSAADKTKLDGITFPLSVANGGTASATALNNGRFMRSTGGAIVEGPAGTSTELLRGDLTWGSVPAGAIPNSGVSAGNYPATGEISTFTVGADGRLTAAGSTTNGSALTQLNASNLSSGTVDAARLPVVPIDKGGTNSGAALSNNRAVISSGGALIESNAGSATQVLLGTSPPSFGAVPAAGLTLAGDVTGAGNANAVSLLQGNTLTLGTLGGGDTGKVLTWNGTALVLDDSHGTIAPLTQVRFVDASTTVPTLEQTGQEWAPYATLAQAMTEIGAGADGSQWVVIVRKPESAGFAVPAKRNVYVRGESPLDNIGTVTWNVGGTGAQSVLSIEAARIGTLLVLDNGDPAPPGYLALQDILLQSLIQVSSTAVITADIGYSSRMNAAAGTYSEWIRGITSITGSLRLRDAITSSTATIDCDSLIADGVTFGANINLHGLTPSIKLTRSAFSAAIDISSTDVTVVVEADSATTDAIRSSGTGLGVNPLSPYSELQLPVSFSGVATEGDLYRIVGDDQVIKAQADSDAGSRAIGVFANLPGHILTGRGLQTKIRVAGGETFVSAAPLYLSQSTAGLATTVRPTSGIVIRVGYVKNPAQYATNGLVDAVIDIAQEFKEPTGGSAVLVGSPSTGLFWSAGDYAGPVGAPSSTSTDVVAWPAPAAGVLKNFRIQALVGPAAPVTLTMYTSAGGDSPSYSASTAVISVGTGNKSGSDTTHSISLNAGDLVIWRNSSANDWVINGLLTAQFIPTNP